MTGALSNPAAVKSKRPPLQGSKMAGEEKQQAKRAFGCWIPDEAREHLKAARREMRGSYETLFPPGYVEHRRAARREMLLAARSVIDAALEHIEGASEA